MSQGAGWTCKQGVTVSHAGQRWGQSILEGLWGRLEGHQKPRMAWSSGFKFSTHIPHSGCLQNKKSHPLGPGSWEREVRLSVAQRRTTQRHLGDVSASPPP